MNDELYVSVTGALHISGEDEIDAYFRRCDNGRAEQLASMTNVRIYSPDDVTEGKFSMERNQQNYLKRNAVYGADETRDIVVVADAGDVTVAIAPTAARYGERWYLVNASGMTALMLGVEMNRQAFCELPEEMAEALNNIPPVFSVSVLPEGGHKEIRYEGEGFSTPEAAVTYYLEGLRNGSIQQMLSAFAWETQNSRYSLKDYILRMQSIFAYAPVRMPGSGELMAGSNLCSLRYQLYRMIYSALRVCLMKDADQYTELLDGYRVDLKSEEEADGFIRQFDNERDQKLAQLENIRLIAPLSVLPRYGDEWTGKQLDMYQRIYGADEILETLAVADMGDETLVCDPLLARYGDRWYLVSVSGFAFSILGISADRQAFMTLDGSLEDVMRLIQN